MSNQHLEDADLLKIIALNVIGNKNLKNYTLYNDLLENLLNGVYFRQLFQSFARESYEDFCRLNTNWDLFVINNVFNSFADLLDPTYFSLYSDFKQLLFVLMHQSSCSLIQALEKSSSMNLFILFDLLTAIVVI